MLTSVAPQKLRTSSISPSAPIANVITASTVSRLRSGSVMLTRSAVSEAATYRSSWAQTIDLTVSLMSASTMVTWKKWRSASWPRATDTPIGSSMKPSGANMATTPSTSPEFSLR
ncbi:hypothetical protein SFUMM280S_08782 [Streptomyces fumanus]